MRCEELFRLFTPDFSDLESAVDALLFIGLKTIISWQQTQSLTRCFYCERQPEFSPIHFKVSQIQSGCGKSPFKQRDSFTVEGNFSRLVICLLQASCSSSCCVVMDDIFTQCREGNSVAVRLWLDNTENDLNLGWGFICSHSWKASGSFCAHVVGT